MIVSEIIFVCVIALGGGCIGALSFMMIGAVILFPFLPNSPEEPLHPGAGLILLFPGLLGFVAGALGALSLARKPWTKLTSYLAARYHSQRSEMKRNG
jgi:hypothetical protein